MSVRVVDKLRFQHVRSKNSSSLVGFGSKLIHYSAPRRSPCHFRVVEHVVPTQHTRQWPRGTEVGHENDLKLAVKQYIPKDNDDPQPGDITLIAAHANGFPKVNLAIPV